MPVLPEAAFFSEARSDALFADRLPPAGRGDLPRILLSIVRHLHAAIRETKPTHEDWRKAIRFLTEVGHASDDRRQEWVLLSDLLGISALVDDLNANRPPGATPNTPRGPFYRADVPVFENGSDICLDGKGTALSVFGTVEDLDGRPIAGARVETWQANGEGIYENQQPDLQPDNNLRGVFLTDSAGQFSYKTVKPAGYPVPHDGPVGALMTQLGLPLRRPAHLHFQISAQGYQTLTTQVFDRDDPHLCEDAVFGVKKGLLGDFRRRTGEAGPSANSLEFTFVLCSQRPGGSR